MLFRSNCAGQGRNQQGPGNQAQPAQQSQPQAGPSQPPLPAPPAPTLDTFQFGHIVSPAVSFPPPLPSSFYPSFNKALSLARRIGVTPTTQTLKRLENVERPSDPRPLKKRSPPKEDEVSLDWSGNEDDVDVFMEESAVAGPSGTTQRYVRTKRADDHVLCQRELHVMRKCSVPGLAFVATHIAHLQSPVFFLGAVVNRGCCPPPSPTIPYPFFVIPFLFRLSGKSLALCVSSSDPYSTIVYTVLHYLSWLWHPQESLHLSACRPL